MTDFNDSGIQEKELVVKNGLLALILIVICLIASILLFIYGINKDNTFVIVFSVILFVLSWVLFAGIHVLKPEEALVVTLFGNYIGTLKKNGIFFINPFASSVNPAAATSLRQSGDVTQSKTVSEMSGKKISMKILTLNNNRQKINDALGNPIEIGIAVIWRVKDTAKAVFNVDNYKEFLSLQCDSSVRNIVKIYPYDIAENIDTTGDGKPDEGSLRGSSEIVVRRIKEEIQSKVDIAGLEILEAKITYLAYAPEIAAVMLQRQQASAIVDARTYIVDGAVGMVQMALDKLEKEGVVNLDEEKKAQMVSNLLVVLCSNKDSQPVVNAGSIY